MNSMECYEILGISSDYSGNDYESVIDGAYNSKLSELYSKRGTGIIDENTFSKEKNKLNKAKKTVLKECRKRANKEAKNTGARETGKSRSILSAGAKNFIVGVCTGAVVTGLVFGVTSCVKNGNDKALVNNLVGLDLSQESTEPTEVINSTEATGATESTEPTEAINSTEATGATESTEPTEAINSTEATGATENTEATEETKANEAATEPTEEVVEAVNYGDINDEALVQKRAAELVTQLSEANIVNPVTTVPYTEAEVVKLIQYLGGIYVPETLEEINELYADALNLLISPVNTDPYLFHVVYASGNDDFKDMAIQAATEVKTVDFAKAFSEYETNGVYPLVRWFQEKREAIYSTADREEINAIYVEVGQVMADIMKGNGGTITVIENGKEVSYTYTSEQILATPASAIQITTEAQLIFANKLEIRDDKDKIIESSQTTWEVYNKFNGEEPDYVTLDEIQAWINNGCYYEWGIDTELEDAQTFGQRIEGDIKGTAQNNYAMNNGNKKSLTK